MCGRAACTLNPETLSCACDYRNASGERRKVPWTKSELKYVPSCNIGPRDVLACVVSGSHFMDKNERVLCPMMWGMIPPWHEVGVNMEGWTRVRLETPIVKHTDNGGAHVVLNCQQSRIHIQTYEGDYRKHKMSTHNGRIEGIQSSNLYSTPLRKGQRCLVVCEGYYEWKAGKTKKDGKQPYYIYATQDKGVKTDDPSSWSDEWSEETGWKGIKVLKMAGIFNRFQTGEGKIIYSCTVITTAANNVLSWLHHRVPVFLNNEEDMQAWLSKDVSMNEAIDRLNALTLSEGDLHWHTVSTLVNNVLYKSDECRKETKPKEEKKSGPTGFMASWLKKGAAESAKKRSTDSQNDKNSYEEGGTPSKVMKKD